MNSYLQVSPLPGVVAAAVGSPPTVPILVVDDDYAKRFALTQLLSPLGYSIVEASSGLGALRCVLAQEFAVILLDVRMPGMDGFETASLIRTRRRSELTPIILITASTSGEIAASGLHGDNVTDFMFAPVEPDELRTTVAVFGNLYLKAQELSRQADELQASANRWKLLTEAVPVGIFHTDRHHRYTYTNPRWAEITGITADAALGQDIGVIVDAEQASRLVAGTEAGRRVEVSHQIEIPVAGADSKIVLVTSKQIPDGDGGIAGWVGTLADVTAVSRDESTVAALN
jgi:PAS domain S-box-containing protein